MFQFQYRIKYVIQCIMKWNKEFFGNIFKSKIFLVHEMEEIQNKWSHGIQSKEIISRGEEIIIDLYK